MGNKWVMEKTGLREQVNFKEIHCIPLHTVEMTYNLRAEKSLMQA